MSRAVIFESFGGPEVLEVRQVAEPHAHAGEVRIRVTAAGLNPMDWLVSSTPNVAAMFGVTPPSGFGYDFAGVIDEVGDGVEGFAQGQRVYGGAMGKAVADFVVMPVPVVAPDQLMHTPDGISDQVASALPTPAATAAAALKVIGIDKDDTVLIGAAGGGVGVFAVQLAKLAGARVIGTGSPGTFDFLRQLGAEPVQYGPDLSDRVRALAPGGITAAADLFGTETAEAAIALGVSPERICNIAAGPTPPGGVRATGGWTQRRQILSELSRLSLPATSPCPSQRPFRSNKSAKLSPGKPTATFTAK